MTASFKNYDPLEIDEDYLSLSRSINSGHLDNDKIIALGSAIERQSELLLDTYLSHQATNEPYQAQKTYRTLREAGVLLESGDTVRLTQPFRRILDIIAKKSYRQHVMPDIEEWKRNLKLLSDLASNSSQQTGQHSETQDYLEQIFLSASELSEALFLEMANIEYTVNAELNNTFDINAKRIILKSLVARIESQVAKIGSLSREELAECYQDNYKVAQILNLTLFNTLAQVLEDFHGYLARTVSLIDSIEREQSRHKTNLWRLHTAMRVGEFDTKQLQLSYDDLIAFGLGVGGLDLPFNHSVNLSDCYENNLENSQFLRSLIEDLPKRAQLDKEKSEKIYQQPIQSSDGTDKEPQKKRTWLQQVALDYFKSNNTDDCSNNRSVKDYWHSQQLYQQIDFKPFLAMILHIYKSDFNQDHVINVKSVDNNDAIIWQLLLQSLNPTHANDTKRITDARIVRYRQSQGLAKSWLDWQHPLS